MQESSSLIKIDKKIVGVGIVKDEKPVPLPLVSYDRDGELDGTTYKIKPPTIQCAMYITVNHIVLEDGTYRPIEVFINTKHTDHHQWITALTRMISGVFRKVGPIEFAIEELEQVYDPKGGYWYDGKMCPSIVAHVGSILRHHCEKIGAIPVKELSAEQRVLIEEKTEKAKEAGVEMMLCGECNQKAVLMLDGCLTCTSCGESKCA